MAMPLESLENRTIGAIKHPNDAILRRYEQTFFRGGRGYLDGGDGGPDEIFSGFAHAQVVRPDITIQTARDDFWQISRYGQSGDARCGIFESLYRITRCCPVRGRR